jgi:hypothetical protein
MKASNRQLDSSRLVRGRLMIRFREGLNLRAVKKNYSRVDWEAGDFHRLDLFLGNADAPWDVLASFAENARNDSRYDVWSGKDPMERAVRDTIAAIGRKSQDGVEVLLDEPGGFVNEILKRGPCFFGVRKGSIAKSLQLAGAVPWSNHRIQDSKLLDGDSLIDLRGRGKQFARIDDQCLVVLTELFVGRPVRLTEASPPNTDSMDTAHKGIRTWLYWGR